MNSTINDIKKLEKDWNGYDAEPIPVDICEKADKILSKLEYIPEIFPTGRQTIQFEYRYKDCSYLEFEIYKDHINMLYVPQRRYENCINKSIEQDQIKLIVNNFVKTGEINEQNIS